MPRSSLCALLLILGLSVYTFAQQNDGDEQLRDGVKLHEYDLSTSGGSFLLEEARSSSFFLLGELHGENEIPTLLRELWPQMRRDGYRYIAAELSPWAANQLEFTPPSRLPKLMTLWSKQEATFVHVPGSSQPVLWGCDMEEVQPHLLIRDLAKENPTNPALAKMQEITKSGYDRKMAPELLELARTPARLHDSEVNDVSLLQNIEATLAIDGSRMQTERKLEASIQREALMKNLFLEHYQKSQVANSGAKVMLRFGRNHLHRGYDERGVSTLGNFVAEFAIAEGKTAFNVAAFGAGGKASLSAQTWDADERGDDLAFEFLASLARYPATVFDLRPLRPILHRIPADNRSALQNRMIYWADSYDAIICYKNVTALAP